MNTFKPNPEQQRFIEEAEKNFDSRLQLPKRSSSYFLDKCSSEIGIDSTPRDDSTPSFPVRFD